MPKGNHLEQIGFCNALYNSRLFADPSQKDYVAENTYQSAGFAALSLILVAFLYYWLLYRSRLLDRGQVDKANKMYLFVYRNLIILYVIIVMFQLFLNILDVITNETDPHLTKSEWNWYNAITGGFSFVLPNLQMALLAFLFTKNTISYKAFQQGYRLAIPFSIVWFIANMISIDRDLSYSTKCWARLIVDGIFLFFCFYIVFRQCQYQWKRRSIVIKYILLVMCIVSLDLITFALQLNSKDGGCIAQLGFYVWVLIYPFIFFITVKDDSDFWWTDASQPLMESTQESIQGLGLFSLPGYREIHFDSEEDHKLRFKKLKQIVSGYVPLISFKKIKWDDKKGAPDDDISSNTSSDNSSLDKTPIAVVPNPNHNNNNHNEPESKSNDNNNNQNNNKDNSKDNSKDSNGKQKLGGGSTGVVFRGKYGKHSVAVKELTRLDKKSEMSWTDLTLIFRESILNSSLAHPNIVKFIGASLTYNAFYLVYEYCEYGDLQQIIVENAHPNNQRLTCIKQRYWYLIDICKGMTFLHSNNFVHRDLKTANVVVTWNNKVKRYIGKICDFGVSRKLPKQQQAIMDINHSILSNDSDYSKLLGSTHGVAAKGTGGGSTLGVNDMTKSPSSGDDSLTGYEQSATVSSAAVRNFHPNLPFTTKEIERTIHVGTPAFLAPEILLKLVKSKGVNLRRKKKKSRKGTAERGTMADHNVDPMIYCDFATDVYSFGMLMWSIITGKLPYKGFKPLDMIKMIYNGDRLKISKREWQIWADEAHIDSNSLKNLLNLCWAQYPQDRPTFNQIDVLLQDILYAAESDPDGAGIWPSTDNGANLVSNEKEKSIFAFSSHSVN